MADETKTESILANLGKKVYQTNKPVDDYFEVKTSSGTALLNDLTYTFAEKNETGDIVFELNNRTKYRMHKFVLLARSKWFRKFFSDKLTPKDEEYDELDIQIKHKEKNVFQVSYDNKETFEQFLNFLYLAGCDLNLDNMIDLLRLSHSFQVSSLRNLICDNLSDSKFVFSMDDYVIIYRLAIRCKNKELIKKSIQNINENDSLVIATEQWLNLTKKRPDLVVDVFCFRS